MHFVQCFSHAIELLLLLLFVDSLAAQKIFCRTDNGTILEKSNKFNTKLNSASRIEDVLIALRWMLAVGVYRVCRVSRCLIVMCIKSHYNGNLVKHTFEFTDSSNALYHREFVMAWH